MLTGKIGKDGWKGDSIRAVVLTVRLPCGRIAKAVAFDPAAFEAYWRLAWIRRSLRKRVPITVASVDG
jgi:hypothetical protein